jgi:hypothetical protein
MKEIGMRVISGLVASGTLIAVMATAPFAQQQVIVTSGDPGPGALASGLLPGLPGLPGSGAKPLEAGTGLIFGQTMDATSQKPVSNVLVTLTVAGSIPVRVLSDGDGRYAFREVPKGSFSVNATKPGYSDGAYGRLRPSGPTQPLQLTDGQRLTDVSLPMWKLGTIAGLVLDESGEPIVGATVKVYQRMIVGGKRQWQATSTQLTDDRGMYRVGSLVPGDYIVALPMTPPAVLANVLAGLGLPAAPARAGGGGGGGIAVAFSASVSSGGGGNVTRVLSDGNDGGLGPAGLTEDGHELWYQTTFYPAVQSSTRAEILHIKAGEERGGVDFSIKAVRTETVSGVLLGSDGPAPSTLVTLVPVETTDLATPVETATTSTDAQGRFSFTRVPAGQYWFRAVKNPRMAIGPGDTQTFSVGGNTMVFRQVVRTSGDSVPPLPTEPTYWIDAPVTVGATDVSDLTMSMRTGVKVSGRIDFSGSATRPTPDQYPTIGITLVPADGRQGAQNGRGRVEPSGNFTTVGVPAGKYVLRVDAPSGWSLRSAAVGGRDLSDAPIELHDGDVDTVTITFTDKKTSLTGQATTPNGNADGKATVIVFPQDASLWSDTGPNPRRLKNARTGSDGSYDVGVPAGDYYVVAVSDTGAFDWNDPVFLAAIAPTAAKVTINEGDRKVQAVRTAPPPSAGSGGGR